VPDLSVFGRYIVGNTLFEDTPLGPLQDHDKLFAFGASIGIPVRNRNQGNLIEAEAAILQAQKRREFLETVVRSEVATAYRRYEAARAAVDVFQHGVIDRNAANVDAIRGAYEIGAYRITELLAEQRRLVDAQFEYSEALAETYRALADLHTAMADPVKP
jgi:cobalt-zinc-cadmium efflux system outer membrane protein